MTAPWFIGFGMVLLVLLIGLAINYANGTGDHR